MRGWAGHKYSIFKKVNSAFGYGCGIFCQFVSLCMCACFFCMNLVLAVLEKWDVELELKAFFTSW